MGTKEGPAVRAPSANFACGAGRCAAEKREQLAPLHRGSSNHAAVSSAVLKRSIVFPANKTTEIPEFSFSPALTAPGSLSPKEFLLSLLGRLLTAEDLTIR